jgi:hypothetical protein
MKKLVFLLLVGGVAWYGWKHYPSLLERRPSHEVVVQNATGSLLTRVRVTVDGQTFVKEELADDAKAVFPFRVGRDASFDLDWQWASRQGENHWSGGTVPKGPMVQRHIMIIDSEGGVLYRTENKQ